MKSPFVLSFVMRLLPLLLLPLAACRSMGVSSSPPAAGRYTLVLIKTGERQGVPAPEQQRVFAGHFENMARLADEGELLVAGPYGSHRSDPALRGVFLLDTADRDEARRIAETDPGFQAGVFRFDYHDFATTADLPRYVEAERAYAARAKAQGREPQPGENGRSYVWLTADHFTGAMSLDLSARVVMVGTREDGRQMVLLDALSKADAERRIAPIAASLGDHELDEWFGSRLLFEVLAPLQPGDFFVD